MAVALFDPADQLAFETSHSELLGELMATVP
jgi:hypothetical protein